MSEYGLMSSSTHYRSFRRRVFPVNHLHWYWQRNKNNQETEHTANSTTDTLKTDRAWFSHLLRHPARKQSGPILTTAEPTLDSEVKKTKLHSGYGRWRQARWRQTGPSCSLNSLAFGITGAFTVDVMNGHCHARRISSNSLRNTHNNTSVQTLCALCAIIYGPWLRSASWLVFNGTFNTNRPYRAIGVWNILCRVRGQDNKTTLIYNKPKKS